MRLFLDTDTTEVMIRFGSPGHWVLGVWLAPHIASKFGYHKTTEDGFIQRSVQLGRLMKLDWYADER